MTKEEQLTSLIAKYMDLLRIQSAKDRDVELNNQLRSTRAQLQALGYVTDDLFIDPAP